jgi:hypothetical protein
MTTPDPLEQKRGKRRRNGKGGDKGKEGKR